MTSPWRAVPGCRSSPSFHRDNLHRKRVLTDGENTTAYHTVYSDLWPHTSRHSGMSLCISGLGILKDTKQIKSLLTLIN